MSGSAYSVQDCSFACIRNATSRGRKGGVCEGGTFGGIYTPRYINAQGNKISAKWECAFYVNMMPARNPITGQKNEGSKLVLQLQAWNSNAENDNGEGLADYMAKTITPGKEISYIKLTLQQYERTVRDAQGNEIIAADGTRLKVPAYSWKVINKGFLLGADGDKWIQAEIADGRRPVNWSNRGSQEYNVWQESIKTRRQQMGRWEGQPVYGYAQVVIPQGVTTEFQINTQTGVDRIFMSIGTKTQGFNQQQQQNTGFNAQQNNGFGPQNNGFTQQNNFQNTGVSTGFGNNGFTQAAGGFDY